MRPIEPDEVLDLVAYERARDAMRARVIALKRRRRVALGDRMSLLFENRETILFQIQEMVRAERMVDPDTLRAEVDVNNQLIPAAGELSATLFLEIPELVQMSPEEVRETVNRFQGLDRPGMLRLEAGAHAVGAVFEAGHSKEEKLAAVHYVRFVVPAAARAVLADPAQPARLVVDHPAYRVAQPLLAEVRDELLADLADLN